MKVNYHTHTFRCHHGYNCEWEYIERAIAAGLEVLGFSEHTPMVFPNGLRSSFRMEQERMGEYIETVWRLKKQYEGRIEIRCGLEAEYFPELSWQQFDWLDDPDSGLEYLILGQHYVQNEYDNRVHATVPTDSEERLAQYVDQVIEAMGTGRYLYICHPDVLNFTGDDTTYYRHMKRLCEEAKAHDMALELNGQGLRSRKAYPTDLFFAIAGDVGNKVILGADAHKAADIANPAEMEVLMGFVKRHRLNLIERIDF